MTPFLPEADLSPESELAQMIATVAGLLRLDAAVLVDQRGEVLRWPADPGAPDWLSAFTAQLPLPQARLVVPDTRQDPAWTAHPAVTARPGLRFVAAAAFGEQTLYLLGAAPRPDAADFEAHLDILTAHGARWAQTAGAQRETLEGLRGLVEGAPLAMYALSLEGLVKHWNTAAEQMLGWRAEELIGRPPPAELAPDPAGPDATGPDTGPDDAPEQPFGVLRKHVRLVQARRSREARAQRKDGSSLDLSVMTGPLRGQHGEVQGLVNIARDVTDELAARRRAEQQRRLMESVLAHANDSVLITEAEPWDEPGPRILYANAAFTRTTGYTAEEVLGQTPRILQGPGSDRAARDKIRRALERWQSVEVEILNYRKDGSAFWVELSIAPVADETGWYTHWISIQRDITERKLSEERLDRERNLVLELAAKGAPLREVLSRLVGMVEEQFAPMRGGIFLPDPDPGRTYAPGLPAPVVRALLTGRPAVTEHLEDLQAAPLAGPLRALAEQHGVRAVWAHPIWSSSGAVLGTFALFGSDKARPNEAQVRRLDAATQLAAVVIERYQAQAELERRALYDALTGLPNRVLFQRRLHDALESARTSGQQVAVGLIDLDRFKVVNDTLGHSAGDALLQQVAARLANGMRPADTLARMGGDEFLLVLPDIVAPEQVHALAERFLTALTRAFLVAGQEVFVRPSIGFTTFPNDGGDPEVLLQQADTAMYRAKALGGGYAFYAPQPESGLTPMALESALNHALARQEFVLHYQPQRRGHDGAVVGVEALLRWRHPELGLVSPAQFIPLAETTGLIVPIGTWVLRTACAQAVRWSRTHPDLRVAVNLSARQFQQDNLIGVVTHTLAETGLAPQRLELELTESLLLSSPDAPETLRRLKALGVRVAIDDFGTGYSSLAYLKKFALDVLKIDRSFVQDLGHDLHGPSKDASIIRAVIGLAHGLGLEVVAEGVENDGQLAFLREHGCDLVQGFLLGHPQEAPALDALLNARTLQER